VRLHDGGGAAISEDGEQTQTSVEFDALEQRQFQIMIESNTDIPQGGSSAVEAGLYSHFDKHNDGLVGSLSVVLLPPAAR
jgi:hypothetical protein